MGIIIEVNPDMALRDISEFKNGNRKKEECIPEKLESNKQYNFLKKGHRVYWYDGEVALFRTEGTYESFSRPLASIRIIESTQFLQKGEKWTKGKYLVTEVFTDDKIHFESCKKIS